MIIRLPLAQEVPQRLIRQAALEIHQFFLPLHRRVAEAEADGQALQKPAQQQAEAEVALRMDILVVRQAALVTHLQLHPVKGSKGATILAT
jgi:hypothetical protein